MAFVNRGIRECTQKLGEADKLGPGEYLSQTILKHIVPSKIPFMTSTSKRNSYYSNDNPGPGEYYQDISHMNYLRNPSKEQSSHNTLSISFRSTIEKLGFMQKEKRFKHNEAKDANPGPGFYFPPLCSKMQLFTKAKAMSKKKQLIALRKDASAPSIPNANDFGFEILSNGRLMRMENPDIEKMFTGEKGDTVGPGCYELDSPKKWHRQGTEWSKFKAQRMKKQTQSICRETIDKNSQTQLRLSLNTTNNTEAKAMPMLKPKLILKKCRIKGSSMPKGKENQAKAEKSFQEKEVSHKLIEQSKSLSKFNSRVQLKNSIFPGPGYYYDMNKMSSFNCQTTPEVNQFFGSKNERFQPQRDLSQVSPATYFQCTVKDKDSPYTTYTNTFKVFKKEPHNRRKQVKAAFSTTQKRFNKSEIIEDHPGPGHYNLLEQNNPKSTKSLIEAAAKFGSTEKRFGSLEKRLKQEFDCPGPGSYFDSGANGKAMDLLNWKGVISEADKTRLHNNKSLVLKSKQPNSSDTSPCQVPPVGLYNPEVLYTIDYNIRKRISNGRPEEVAFSSTVVKKSSHVQKSSSGPGYYYKEHKAEAKQIYPPFNQSDKRAFNNFKASSAIGPGEYYSDSYFDWNKKSFNNSFI